AGLPAENRADRVQTVKDVVTRYLAHYGLNHRDGSIRFSTQRLAHVLRKLGSMVLPDLTEDAVRDYIRRRRAEGAAGRTINMELGELSRAIGRPWSVLWPKVRKMEERKDVGKALSPAEESRLLEALRLSPHPWRTPMLTAFVRIALLTGMRSGEITSLTWGQADLERRVLTVGRAKTACGTGRQIPMNAQLFAVVSAHADWFTDRFGAVKPDHYLFPFGKPTPNDPTRHITDMSSAWEALRARAGVECRLHDLRHTAATKMAEAGVPESTMLALMGHMSRAMLERYSHIRMAAKREAVEALAIREPAQNSSVVPTKSPTTGGMALVQ
ncbi:MAG TPA: site-specific integrase, partial [Bryobacteraceae bacterium]|nr:site-specific integrase [Bryobacteraceae bacterium]